jgi:antitoxin YefM
MDAITYTAVRNNLSKTMDKVNEDHAPVIITRQNGSSAVLMSLDDFNAFEETAYLMRSPANAARLSKAVMDVAKGKVKARKPIERD